VVWRGERKDMTYKEFEVLARDALGELPKEFKDKLQNVDVVIEEDFDMDMVKRLGLGVKGRLLGLYHGVPLKNRTHLLCDNYNYRLTTIILSD